MNMLSSHCQYVAAQTYWLWNCHQNSFTQLTLIYGWHDALLDMRHSLHAVEWFFGAPECRLAATKLQIWSSRWTIPSKSAFAHLKWFRKLHSPADSKYSPYQRYSSWWLQCQHRIAGPEIQHTCPLPHLPPCKPLLAQQSTGNNDFMQHITHREAVSGTVICCILDPWHYEVLWTYTITGLLWYSCSFVCWMLSITLHTIHRTV